nr:hypothetical protein [Tanacetum cinerariifolium]
HVLYDWMSRASVLVKFSIKLAVDEMPESRHEWSLLFAVRNFQSHHTVEIPDLL